MKTLNVHEAETHLSAVLAEVADKQESFLICRNGRPVADLVPHRVVNRFDPHPVMGAIGIDCEPTETLTELSRSVSPSARRRWICPLSTAIRAIA